MSRGQPPGYTYAGLCAMLPRSSTAHQHKVQLRLPDVCYSLQSHKLNSMCRHGMMFTSPAKAGGSLSRSPTCFPPDPCICGGAQSYCVWPRRLRCDSRQLIPADGMRNPMASDTGRSVRNRSAASMTHGVSSASHRSHPEAHGDQPCMPPHTQCRSHEGLVHAQPSALTPARVPPLACV
jgi:hypothetical protein